MTSADQANNGGNLLELVDVSVNYGAVAALDAVSMGVRKGEVVAVMGPNGAGKSTVLKAIMGLAPVTGGRVYWRQNQLVAATHEVVKEGISFVPQGRRVFTHLTIQENLEMGCLYLKDRVEKQGRLDSVMGLFPILQEKRRDLASQMSGGQQQMLALGRGLMAGPEMLLLDEPTLGLAPIVVKEVFQKVAEISERLDTTIFVVEHNIKGVLDIVDRGLRPAERPRSPRRHPPIRQGLRHTDPGLPWQSRRQLAAAEQSVGWAHPRDGVAMPETQPARQLRPSEADNIRSSIGETTKIQSGKRES